MMFLKTPETNKYLFQLGVKNWSKIQTTWHLFFLRLIQEQILVDYSLVFSNEYLKIN